MFNIACAGFRPLTVVSQPSAGPPKTASQGVAWNSVHRAVAGKLPGLALGHMRQGHLDHFPARIGLKLGTDQFATVYFM